MTLWDIRTASNWIASVGSREGGVIGHYGSEGYPVLPDNAAVIAAMPHQWRKAASRVDVLNWWCVRKDNGDTAYWYCNVVNARGKTIGRIYANPYEFKLPE